MELATSRLDEEPLQAGSCARHRRLGSAALVARVWAVVALSTAAIGCADGSSPSVHSEAGLAVIYGEDDRKEPHDYPAGSAIHAWSRSSAMQVDTDNLRRTKGSAFTLVTKETYSESMGASGRPLCAEEPFQDQPVLGGICSGFLAAPDIVITAGHCVSAPGVCPYVAFVFGAGYGRDGRDPRRVGPEDVYFCKEVLALVTKRAGADYAVVKVDRPVVGRAPLPLRRAGRVEADDEELVVIGNPMGLPTKIAAHGRVLDDTPAHFFRANTDSYGGGSGSVVMGLRSGLVEGVLARGESDLMQRDGCWISKACPEDASTCRGEDVTRATEFAGYVQQGVP